MIQAKETAGFKMEPGKGRGWRTVVFFRVVTLLCMVLQWRINVGSFIHLSMDTDCIAHVNYELWPLGNSIRL